MSEEKRYSVNHAANGCLASFVFSLVASLILMGGVYLFWRDSASDAVVGSLQLLIWAASLVFGGYVAAKKGKTTGWTNSLVVGCFALIFSLGKSKLPDIGPLSSLSHLLHEPLEHWRELMRVGLSIPAALLGGYLWVRRTKTRTSVEPADRPSA